MATKLAVTFMCFAKSNESPNFLTCRQTCPFPETTDQTLKDENPINSSIEFPVNTVCCLARLRKFELTLATSCKDREFSILCEKRPVSRLDCIFRRKFRLFVRNEKSEAFWNCIRIFNLADLTRSVYEKYSSPCNSLLRFIYFRKPSLDS
jgi:hypothetical protein